MVQPVRSRYDAESSEFSAFIQPLRRWFWYILGFVILATAIATYIGARKEPTYTASVQIVLEPRDGSSAINDLVTDSLSNDASAIETQIKLLRTHSHIQNVITALALEERWAHKVSGDDNKSGWSDLIETALSEDGVNGYLKSWGGALINLAIGETSEPSSPVDIEPAASPRNESADISDGAEMDALYRLFNQNYRVQQEGQSYVISIYYTSENPVEAAEIANRSADVFIETKRSEKLGVTGRTSDWLSKRAQTLYDELQELNEEISQFRDTNPVAVREAPRADSEVAVLTTELAGVRGRLSAKNATLELARETQNGEGDLRGIAEINTSITLQNLLGEQSSLLAQGGELSKTYGDRHPLMVQFEAEKVRLSSKIRQETARIVASIENDVRILEAQRDSLEQEIGGLRRQEVGKAKAKFQLEDLLRRSDEKRDLYQKALQRSKEIGEQQDIVGPDMRLVSRATVPRSPSSPSAKIFAMIGFCGSSILSIMLVLFVDRLDKRLRTPNQIKDEFGLETVALVPQVSKSPPPHRRLIELPRSSYADSMRSIFMAIRQMASRDDAGQVVLMTSGLPDEGKSTLSLSLATAAAMQTKDVLIIDMDLRHPQIHKMIGHEPKNGIVEYCRDSSLDLEDCLFYEKETGLTYLFVNDTPHDPSATVNSDRFTLLMERLRDDFDLIIIDAAPVLAVTETRLLLSHVDLVNFCIRWGKTDIETTTEALDNIWSNETSPPILAVLTRVDIDNGAAYGLSSSRHRKALKKYYQET